MTTPSRSTGPVPAKEFLIKDFEHWAHSYAQNEELGEKRLASFVGLVTAVLGGLALLAKHGDELRLQSVRVEAIGALVALALLGFFTLLRILRRNDVTSGYLNAMKEIRRALLPRELVDRYMAKVPRSTHRGVLNGGLAHVVIVIESGLLALLGWTVWPETPYMAAVAGLGSCAVLEMYRRHRESTRDGKRDDGKRDDATPDDATPDDAPQSQTFRANVGLVVLNPAGDVLALARRGLPGAWQLPQGGIEAGEEPLAAAYRELEEETGLRRADVELLGERDGWTAYELPPAYRSPKTGRGQVQKWFAFGVRDPSVIDNRSHASDEASQLAWRAFSDVKKATADFRKATYETIDPWLHERAAAFRQERGGAG